MENSRPSALRALLPIIIVFLIINGVLLIWNKRLEASGVDTSILQLGNLLLFTIFLLSTVLQHKAMADKSTQLFLRNVYGGMMLKLFGCAMAAFIYIYLARDGVNKPALFGCMFLYMVYSAIELRIVLKKSKSS